MIRHIVTASFIVLCGAGLARAQDQPAKPVVAMAPPLKPATVSALMIDVTLSRYLGDKRVSSTPYTLSVIPDQRASLRMGGDVPIPQTTFTPVSKEEGKPATNPLTSFGYRSFGTNIDVSASAGVDGQYRFTLTIEDSSIYPAESAPPTTKTTGAPAFRRYSSSNAIALRDGQSLEYTMATDRLSSEVVRVNVKLTVVK